MLVEFYYKGSLLYKCDLENPVYKKYEQIFPLVKIKKLLIC